MGCPQVTFDLHQESDDLGASTHNFRVIAQANMITKIIFSSAYILE